MHGVSLPSGLAYQHVMLNLSNFTLYLKTVHGLICKVSVLSNLQYSGVLRGYPPGIQALKEHNLPVACPISKYSSAAVDDKDHTVGHQGVLNPVVQRSKACFRTS